MLNSERRNNFETFGKCVYLFTHFTAFQWANQRAHIIAQPHYFIDVLLFLYINNIIIILHVN